VVVGTGGYVTWPIIKMAQSLKIPTVIHESNACPGLVTKLLSKKCDKVLLNLPGSENEFRKKDNLKTVGNPVREDFLKADRESSRKKLGISRKELLISSFGGSGGSEKLNNVIIEVMRKHSAKNRNIKHLHSCGRKYYRDIKEKFPDLTSGKCGCEIKAYVEDMATVMAASDIVISRCGAMTLCEICSVGTAAILIPSPNVTNNHQYKNAKLICDAGAAIMIEEDQLSADSLIAVLNELEALPKRRAEISQKASAFYPKNSKEIIAEEIIKLI
jgi:UDP-N-acetylglucosamine--N-acetylmuramyl-(pentapeptide) pyrophosphoryl-undecaprenol N-acetylglucosamine transferase